MPRIPLTPRPRVPVLVHATALGTLVFAAAACGDDGGPSTNSTDVHPTAGPCYHQQPPPPECASTGTPELTTGTTGTDTGASTAVDGATDQHPTAGPCAHDPMAPECASTTDGGSDSGTATGGSDSTGTDTGTSTSSG